MQTKKYDKHDRLKSIRILGLRCRYSTLDLRLHFGASGVFTRGGSKIDPCFRCTTN